MNEFKPGDRVLVQIYRGRLTGRPVYRQGTVKAIEEPNDAVLEVVLDSGRAIYAMRDAVQLLRDCPVDLPRSEIKAALAGDDQPAPFGSTFCDFLVWKLERQDAREAKDCER